MIRFEDYSFSYGNEDKEQGIRDVDLSIEKGECILFCGASGCGKTTLLRSVNGIIPHMTEGVSSGKVYVDGKDVSNIEMYELAKAVTSVFQNPKSQFFNTDVESEIVFSLENQGIEIPVIEEKLKATIETLRIEGLSGRSMFELSGGEKQQIAFAGAYISSAPVVTLDEPTANLDPDAIVKIRGILKKMKEAGKTILISEHRLSWLKDIVDRVVFMRDGRIEKIFTGPDFFGMNEAKRKELGLRELNQSMAGGRNTSSTAATIEKKRLEVKDLSLAYKKHIVQTGLNFSIYEGEILGIVGVNGAGKTTLLRALAGLSEPKSGTIILEGKKSRSKTRRKCFGMVMQDVNYQLFADSCENECMLGNPAVDEEKATKLLKEALLENFNERHPQSLSGGQKQRLALAVCKASDKDILLLDEPTSGLDYQCMLAVRDVLKGLVKEGKTVIVVTHDREFIDLVCDRTIELKKSAPA